MEAAENAPVEQKIQNGSPLYLSAAVKLIVFIFILFIPLKDSVYEITNGLIGILFCYLMIKNKDKDFLIGNTHAVLIFCLIFLSMTLSNLVGDAGLYGWEKQVQFFYRYALLYFALLYFLKKGYVSIHFLFRALLFSLGIQAFSGIYQYLQGLDALDGGGRLTAGVFNPNPFGFLMMVGALFIIGVLNPRRFKKKYTWELILFFTLLCMFLFCLLYSGSRSSWLGFACGILFFSVARFKHWNGYVKIFFIAILLAMPVLLLSNDFFVKRVTAVSINYGYRPECWKGAMVFIADAPVWGHGIRDDMVFHRLKRGPLTSPHNSYIEIIVYLGFVGFLAYGYLIFITFRCAFILSGTTPVYLSVLAGIAASAFFDHSFIASQILLSVCCLLCACMGFHGDTAKT